MDLSASEPQQRILAVDDEPHMLKLLERIISEKTPYPVRTTNNALEVPAILSEERFDLVISDLRMPGMNGLDVLRWLKEHDRPEVLIIITAFGSLETAIEALSLGVFDYITKPFKREQIMHTIDRAMRWQQMRRDAARMSEVFETEPIDEARRAFEDEYLRRLADRCEGRVDEMARRSGLPSERISDAIRDLARPTDE